MKTMQRLLETGNHISGFIIRLVLATVILPHGLQQTLGWFGGYGFGGTMQYYINTIQLPGLVALLVILLQSAGAVLILTGLITRPMALATIILFSGMIFTSHIGYGFFMNWNNNQQGEGFEYHILVIGLSVLLLLNGAGRYSLDGLVAKKMQRTPLTGKADV